MVKKQSSGRSALKTRADSPKPAEGGRYVRQADGTLTRVAADAEDAHRLAAATTEPAPEAPADDAPASKET